MDRLTPQAIIADQENEVTVRATRVIDMKLTVKDRRELVAILDVLSAHIESAIESGVKEYIADEDPKRIEKLMTGKVNREFVPMIRQDRKLWRQVENWKIHLEHG